MAFKIDIAVFTAAAASLALGSFGCLNGEDGADGINGVNGINGTNGTNGTSASIQTSLEPAGEHCPNGGIKIEVLSDGIVQESETQYLCGGTNGQNGMSASIQTTQEPAGEHCPNGGTRIDILLDGKVQEGQSQYICNGTDGRDGCSFGQYRDNNGECAPIPPEFVFIPAGTFVLSHDTELYSAGDTVKLDSFILGKTPVTVAQFEKCVEAGACSAEHYQSYSEEKVPSPLWPGPGSHHFCQYWRLDLCTYGRGEAFADHPMDCVDWYAANEYCTWIGGRLPTEEEWEYAATHDGTRNLGTKYPWGDDEPTHCVTANYRIIENRDNNDGARRWYVCYGTTEVQFGDDEFSEKYNNVTTSPVGTYSPAGDSPLGLVEMLGNVWEITATHPTLEHCGWTPGDCHVIKGASGIADDFYLTLDIRGLMPNDMTVDDYCGFFGFIGFRCAK